MEFGEDDDSASRSNDIAALVPSNQNLAYGSAREQSFVDNSKMRPLDLKPRNSVPSSASQEEASRDERDFSDVVLKYINQILMEEEDMDEENFLFHESSEAFQAAERSFYEVLGKKNYPASPDSQLPTWSDDQKMGTADDGCAACINSNCHCSGNSFHPLPNCVSLSSDGCSNNFSGLSWECNPNNYGHSEGRTMSLEHNTGSSQFFFVPTSCGDNIVPRLIDSPENSTRIDHASNDESIIQVRREGFEEASSCGLFIELTSNEAMPVGPNAGVKHAAGETEKLDGGDRLIEPRGRKNPHSEDWDQPHARGTKQSAVATDVDEGTEMFDRILLTSGEECESALREAFQSRTRIGVQLNDQIRATHGKKSRRRRKQKAEGEVVDLRKLLTHCAKAVGNGNRVAADELLLEVRKHSSPTGDGTQRLASYFADAFEARLAGCGTRSYTALVSRPSNAADSLKAMHFYLSVCPLLKLSNFFSNKTIMHVAEKATRLHIIDFGIFYGFQWPSFIEQLSCRRGGPPKLHITGIDLPIPGFRPKERIVQTGHRLAKYAERFNVPFKYSAITQKWEAIQVEDIEIESGEVLVVNCIFRFRYLLDESVVSISPRDTVLNLIRKLNPDVFIHGIVNASYSTPFFLARFREALFHYSAVFDSLEATVPHDIPERMLVERDSLGREIMNVLACEGLERIERAETYKQWQTRNQRAGFTQLPLNDEIVNTAKEWVKSVYHKNFLVDVDGKWLLQGWKGRILNALACWKPVVQ